MAVEIRADDEFMKKVLGKITDMKTLLTVSAERAFMRKLDGGCSTPVGCNATFEDGKVCDIETLFNYYYIIKDIHRHIKASTNRS